MWNDLENKIISYVDDATLYAEVVSPVLNKKNINLLKEKIIE